MGLSVEGLGFRFRVKGLGLRVEGLRFRIKGLGFRVLVFGFRFREHATLSRVSLSPLSRRIAEPAVQVYDEHLDPGAEG